MSFTDTAKHWLWGCAVWTAASRSVVNVAMPHLRGRWSPTKAILRTLEVCCIRYSFARRQSAAGARGSFFSYADRDIHAQKGRGLADEGAPQRQNVGVIPSHSHPDQIAIADNAVGWIEIDPAGAWKIDLHPGMRSTAAHYPRVVGAGNENVPADEASGQPQGARCLHHQHCEVPATAAACLQRFGRVLHSLLAAPGVGKFLLDGECHGAQQTHGAGGSRRMQKPFHPVLHFFTRIVVHQRASQVGKLFGGVAEGIPFRELFQLIVGQRGLEMLQRDNAFKAQTGGRASEGSHRHRVVEHVMEQTKMRRLGRDFETRLEQPEVVTFPGPEHHAMLAQLDGFRVTISRGVSYREEAHLKSRLRGSAKLCHAFRNLVRPDLEAFEGIRAESGGD